MLPIFTVMASISLNYHALFQPYTYIVINNDIPTEFVYIPNKSVNNY